MKYLILLSIGVTQAAGHYFPSDAVPGEYPKMLTEGLWMNEDGDLLTSSATWPANEDGILTKDGWKSTIRLPDGTGVVVDKYPDDPWVYDPELAPYDVEVLGVYNYNYRLYQRVKRTKEYGWESMEPTYSSGTVSLTTAPHAWLEIPKPKYLPKLVDGMTKEQLLEKLKEFEK